jgi:hypothetical protein
VHLLSTSTGQSRRYLSIAHEVYNRVTRPVQRVKERGRTLPGSTTYLQAPTFTLAPDTPPTPTLTLQWPLKSYDVYNQWRILHGGYDLLEEGNMVIAFVMDGEGEGWTAKAWRVGGKGGKWVVEAVRMVWEFFSAYAATVAVEWRLAVCRYGLMVKEEVEGESHRVSLCVWGKKADGRVLAWRDIVKNGSEPVTVLMTDRKDGSPGPTTHLPVPNISPAVYADPHATLIDETLVGHTYYMPLRVPVVLPRRTSSYTPYQSITLDDELATTTMYPQTTFINSIFGESATYHQVAHRGVPGKEEDTDQVMGREYYRLACLGKERFGFGDGDNVALPVHLAAIAAVERGLQGWMWVERNAAGL